MITLKTLPQATAQEVFDQITQHLLKQGKAARSATGACRYRTETAEGVLKCAAGCLIADDEYSEKWENTDWPSLVADKFVPDSHERLIYRMTPAEKLVAKAHYSLQKGLVGKLNHFFIS